MHNFANDMPATMMKEYLVAGTKLQHFLRHITVAAGLFAQFVLFIRTLHAENIHQVKRGGHIVAVEAGIGGFNAPRPALRKQALKPPVVRH